MSSKAANVRERFSLEFVSANPEMVALKGLLKAGGALPDLVLFDADSALTPPVIETSETTETYVDPVDELRMLFGSVNK